MKSIYKRDIAQQYFRPLKSFHYNPSIHWPTANNKQDELADKLSKDYGIHEGNIFRLIIYADIAWKFATESEIQLYYSDLKEIADFEKESFPIEKIVFRGYAKSFEITNPYLIDKLYYSMIDLLNFQKIIKEKKAKKKRPSAKIIRLIATEIYNELTQTEKIESWSSVVIAGFIFGLYNIGLKENNGIPNLEQYIIEENRKADAAYNKYVNERRKSFKSMGLQTGDLMNRNEYDLKTKTNKTPEKNYPTFLYGRMKRYINF